MPEPAEPTIAGLPAGSSFALHHGGSVHSTGGGALCQTGDLPSDS